jgi:hypothetical protein
MIKKIREWKTISENQICSETQTDFLKDFFLFEFTIRAAVKKENGNFEQANYVVRQ